MLGSFVVKLSRGGTEVHVQIADFSPSIMSAGKILQLARESENII
jgi:hypothetical protein